MVIPLVMTKNNLTTNPINMIMTIIQEDMNQIIDQEVIKMNLNIKMIDAIIEHIQM